MSVVSVSSSGLIVHTRTQVSAGSIGMLSSETSAFFFLVVFLRGLLSSSHEVSTSSGAEGGSTESVI